MKYETVGIHSLFDDYGHTAAARRLIADAEFVLAIDVMTREVIDLFGGMQLDQLRGLNDGSQDRLVVEIEVDFDTRELELAQALVTDIKLRHNNDLPSVDALQ